MHSLTVLVLEDHAFQRKAAVAQLRNIGIGKILEASDGHEAIHVIAHGPDSVDVVLCDLQMEGMDGVEFIRHMAEGKLAAAVILVSSLEPNLIHSVETMANAHRLNVLGTLEKPIKRDLLASCLSQYLDWKNNQTLRTPARFQDMEQMPPEEIELALKNKQFVPFFQPKVRVSDRVAESIEVLARWNHPEKGLISPGQFIPYMEKNGLIIALSDLILEKALIHLKEWLDEGIHLNMAVNISPLQVMDTNLTEEIKGIVSQFSIPPERLILEITESAVMDNLAGSLETLTRLRLKGFGLSIDDFGTGYSSMQQLSQAPFTEIKIDRSFVRGLKKGSKNHSIVESTIDLAKRLHLKTVIEGVETQAEWDAVAEIGCDLIQGYFIARPMDAEAFYQWYQEHHK